MMFSLHPFPLLCSTSSFSFVVVVVVQRRVWCELENSGGESSPGSSFSDDEKSDARDDETKDPLLTEDEQKEDDIARAKSRVVNPLFSLRILLKKRCRSRYTKPHRTAEFSRTFPH